MLVYRSVFTQIACRQSSSRKRLSIHIDTSAINKGAIGIDAIRSKPSIKSTKNRRTLDSAIKII